MTLLRLLIRGKKRKSGHDFIIHPVEVATHLARLELDPKVIIAGLLHDVIEDTDFGSIEIEEKFGKEVSEIVISLTKLTVDEDTLIKNLDEKNMRRFFGVCCKRRKGYDHKAC